MTRDALPLSVPVYQILISLTGGDAHGYALIGDIRTRTGGEVELTASTLYGALQRMHDNGWIEETDFLKGTEGPRRRVYGITDAGREIASDEARRLHRSARQAVDAQLLDAKALRLKTP